MKLASVHYEDGSLPCNVLGFCLAVRYVCRSPSFTHLLSTKSSIFTDVYLFYIYKMTIPRLFYWKYISV